MQTAQLKIGICEDHEVFSDGLCILFQTSPRLKNKVKLILKADNGASLLNSTEIAKLDLLILDIDLPCTNGMKIARTIREKYPRIDILMLTQFRNIEYLQELMCAGVKGYIIKNEPKETLVGAIEDVIAGNIAISPSFCPNTMNSTKQIQLLDKRFDILSPREVEILTFVAKGMKTQQIADILNISSNTVSGHRSKICRKLKTQNLDELVEIARRKGLIS